MDPSRHADKRGFIESVLGYIPGFHGYLEKEYRRESDQLARNWIADQLGASKRALDSHLMELVERSQIDALPKADRLKARIEALASRIRGDVQGYGGFFDFVRVDEALLEQVYEHDMSLLGEVKAFASEVQQLGAPSGDTAAVLDGLLAQVDELSRKYEYRRELLAGLGSER